MRILIIDTETTGLPQDGKPLEDQPYVIEFGAIEVEAKSVDNGYYPMGTHVTEVRRHSQLFRVPIPLPKKITEITGITDEMLEGMCPGSAIIGVVDNALTGIDCVIAHNLAFDVGQINNQFARYGFHQPKWPDLQVCTVQEYTPMFGRRPKLADLLGRLCPNEAHPEQTHRAVDDCEMLFKALFADNFFEVLL